MFRACIQSVRESRFSRILGPSGSYPGERTFVSAYQGSRVFARVSSAAAHASGVSMCSNLSDSLVGKSDEERKQTADRGGPSYNLLSSMVLRLMTRRHGEAHRYLLQVHDYLVLLARPESKPSHLYLDDNISEPVRDLP
jgi:hypothetical protein